MQLAGAESWYPHFPEDFVVVQFKKSSRTGIKSIL